MGCDEIECVLCVDVRVLFGDRSDAGKTRTLFEARAELRELFGRANGVGFDATVAQIAHEAAEAETFGFGLREKAEADALHETGDEETGCFLCVVHKP
jgi:hypothetical protein